MSKPLLRHAFAVRLELPDAHETITNVSGAVVVGDRLWIAGDERSAVACLRKLPPDGTETLRFGDGRIYDVASLLDLPADGGEADLEGLAVVDGYLWVAGSHARTRRKPKDKDDDIESAARLARVKGAGNRSVLARLPLEPDDDDGMRIVRRAADGRRAERLSGASGGSPIRDVLRRDEHLAPFLGIPGKDNGFDIEGVAVAGHTILVGLRGPVLRGWSMVLELGWRSTGKELCLAALDDAGAVVRKHFLDLQGLGVRDLHFDGDDLLILAGPTMVLDGEIRLFRWTGAKAAFAANEEPVRFQRGLEPVATLAHGQGSDRAEAICCWPGDDRKAAQRKWIVLYDAPGRERMPSAGVLLGDLLAIAPSSR